MANKIPQVETVHGRGLRGDFVYNDGEESDWGKFQPTEAILGNENFLKRMMC